MTITSVPIQTGHLNFLHVLRSQFSHMKWSRYARPRAGLQRTAKCISVQTSAYHIVLYRTVDRFTPNKHHICRIKNMGMWILLRTFLQITVQVLVVYLAVRQDHVCLAEVVPSKSATVDVRHTSFFLFITWSLCQVDTDQTKAKHGR